MHIADKVPAGCGTIPRSSKLLGITHEFIFPTMFFRAKECCFMKLLLEIYHTEAEAVDFDMKNGRKKHATNLPTNMLGLTSHRCSVCIML